MKGYILILYCLITSSFSNAEVIVDNSFGSSVALDGPYFSIYADYGQQKGNNLFHSFSDFNLKNYETAHFTSPDSVTRIITRVTGGRLSKIDGLLKVTSPKTDFYFLNPAGIHFGANASLDMDGSFYATTADKLLFSTGESFFSQKSSNSTLSSAPPEAFGFINQAVGKIKLEGSKLYLSGASQTIGLIGSDIQFLGNAKEKVEVLAGDVIKIAAIKEGEINLANPELSIDKGVYRGDLKAKYTHIGDTLFKRGSGKISIQADNMEWSQSSIQRLPKIGDGLGINIKAGDFIADNSSISVISRESGIASTIELSADNAELLNQSTIIMNAGSGSADAGNIKLDISEKLNIFNTSQIANTSVNTYIENIEETGHPGEIDIKAKHIKLNNLSAIRITRRESKRGGNLNIQADELLLNNAFISGGNSLFDAPSSIIERGNAGDINIHADLTKLENNSSIYNSTATLGQGGSVFINGGTLVLSNSDISAGSLSREETAGDAGDINISVNNLQLLEGSLINTSTINADGGDILLTINNHLKIEANSKLLTSNFGNMENIASTENGGNIGITSHTISLYSSTINAQSEYGDGGNVDIDNHSLLHMDKSTVIASVYSGIGDGGNITLDSSTIALNQSTFMAQAEYGNGGNIQINTKGMFELSPSRFNASSEFGVDGEIAVVAPEIDISDALTIPQTGFLSSELIQNCTSRNLEDNNAFIVSQHKIQSSPYDLKILATD
ncbi:two-partner secretion domain-containing protein [Candidatus Venteria ishoeyi]|uniref:Haemagglutination activity domain protein n=1 Tax=Candidatus Venteria ishoeyi TaxID=1899563 RepID=A0A1H6F667_9GAMM|nr:filamentous hemagglutinin N-terminal domain-containing protein [Candidatus Venteria ishoeyi]SEH04475.1 haemagglutination activity domain protein [Candidatus Venteria ishoeyi]